MARAIVHGVRLAYDLHGAGDPVVLVHGSWDSRRDWDLLVPMLEGSFRVLAYDRRGHSESERPSDPGSVREDVADLAALIEQLGLAPAWVVGNSFGGSIALRLACARPELVRGVAAHEPPLFALLAGDASLAPLLGALDSNIRAVAAQIAAGAHEAAAEQFVERVALGPGSWAQLPPALRATLVENAPTFLDETRDPEQLVFDLAWARSFAKPALLTRGDQSPPLFAPVVTLLGDAFPRAEVVTLPGAGHIPHATHPEAYARVVADWMRRG